DLGVPSDCRGAVVGGRAPARASHARARVLVVLRRLRDAQRARPAGVDGLIDAALAGRGWHDFIRRYPARGHLVGDRRDSGGVVRTAAVDLDALAGVGCRPPVRRNGWALAV
ncbi:MAG: hypothetical protein AVDCRST_MAG39-225, partial [uncultured Sphingomonadaceae bacterium]